MNLQYQRTHDCRDGVVCWVHCHDRRERTGCTVYFRWGVSLTAKSDDINYSIRVFQLQSQSLAVSGLKASSSRTQAQGLMQGLNGLNPRPLLLALLGPLVLLGSVRASSESSLRLILPCSNPARLALFVLLVPA